MLKMVKKGDTESQKGHLGLARISIQFLWPQGQVKSRCVMSSPCKFGQTISPNWASAFSITWPQHTFQLETSRFWIVRVECSVLCTDWDWRCGLAPQSIGREGKAHFDSVPKWKVTRLLYNAWNSLVLVFGGKSKYQVLISLSYTCRQLIIL